MIATMKQSGNTGAYVNEYSADTLAELDNLPKYPDCGYGSTCLVIEDSSVYILNGQNEWVEL